MDVIVNEEKDFDLFAEISLSAILRACPNDLAMAIKYFFAYCDSPNTIVSIDTVNYHINSAKISSCEHLSNLGKHYGEWYKSNYFVIRDILLNHSNKVVSDYFIKEGIGDSVDMLLINMKFLANKIFNEVGYKTLDSNEQENRT